LILSAFRREAIGVKATAIQALLRHISIQPGNRSSSEAAQMRIVRQQIDRLPLGLLK
jgi:hypothetical protein